MSTTTSSKKYAIETYDCGKKDVQVSYDHSYETHHELANYIKKNLIGEHDYVGLLCERGGDPVYRTIFYASDDLVHDLKLSKGLIHNLRFARQAYSQNESHKPETVVYRSYNLN